jgi:hypothetical protein
MSLTPLRHYSSVWAVDFEFTAHTGERQVPLCCVARELRTGRLVRLWLTDAATTDPPYGTAPDMLFIAYYASAELGCHLSLDWPMPTRILDLYAEFRCLTSGLPVPCGRGLLGALAYYGLDAIGAVEKDSMRQLAMRGGPYSAGEKVALLDYCQSDVDALARLLPVMLPKIDLPRALLRGRYLAAAANMEWAGVPIDVDALARLRENWTQIKVRLITAVDAEYGVFVPVGQRTLDPQSRFGAAVLETATEWGIDVHRLADAAEMLWHEERESNAELFAARRAARQATGLTLVRINQWEDAGHDSSDWPGLDVKARELARVYPALGIGIGYTSDGGEDRTDYAGLLWEVLRNRDERTRPRHDPDLLRRAAELVASCHVDERIDFGPMRFSVERWAGYLAHKNIPWPRLPSGALALDDDTFREMARAYPADVAPIRELRHTLSQLRLNELAVGVDGCNRCLLSAFGAKTGRNTPSNSKFVFGPSTWLRSLIRPTPGRAVAYVDWSAQEYGIAAALSGDRAMQRDYQSGDPYLSFAKRAGAVPEDATKQTHGKERDLFKVCCGLGAMYGAGEQSLAARLGISPAHARELLRLHRESYSDFWRWSDAVQDFAMLHGYLETAFGWRVHVGPNANPRSLRNFPMQGNGAEMMRLACCLTTERGITVCAPVHDALLVEADADTIETVVARTQAAMQEASELVLPGFPLRTDAKVVRWPDRYLDERGRTMWETVGRLLAELEHEASDPDHFGPTTRPKLAQPAPYLIPSSPVRDRDSAPSLPFCGNHDDRSF